MDSFELSCFVAEELTAPRGSALPTSGRHVVSDCGSHAQPLLSKITVNSHPNLGKRRHRPCRNDPEIGGTVSE